jgi:hypothetical protein
MLTPDKAQLYSLTDFDKFKVALQRSAETRVTDEHERENPP